MAWAACLDKTATGAAIVKRWCDDCTVIVAIVWRRRIVHFFVASNYWDEQIFAGKRLSALAS